MLLLLLHSTERVKIVLYLFKIYPYETVHKRADRITYIMYIEQCVIQYLWKGGIKRLSRFSSEFISHLTNDDMWNFTTTALMLHNCCWSLLLFSG